MLQNLVARRSLIILHLPLHILLLQYINILLMGHVLKCLEIPLVYFVELLCLFVLVAALIIGGLLLRHERSIPVISVGVLIFTFEVFC